MNISISSVKYADNLVKVSIAGKLNIESAIHFDDETRQLLHNAGATILFDLKGVTYLDSSGIGALIKFMNQAKGCGIRLILYNVKPDIQKVFTVAYLDKFFIIKTAESLQSEYPAVFT